MVFKDSFSAPIAKIVMADYRMDNTEQIIVCAEDGEVGRRNAQLQRTALVSCPRCHRAPLARLRCHHAMHPLLAYRAVPSPHQVRGYLPADTEQGQAVMEEQQVSVSPESRS